MATLDPDMGALVADAMRRLGIVLRLGEPVTGFDTAEGRVRAVTTTAGTLPADLVILGLGVRPNSRLAAGSSPTGACGLRPRRCGRPATASRRSTGCRAGPVAIALGTHANKQGRVAGINLGGGYATFLGVVGTAVTKICGLEIARTGLGDAEATAAGFATEAVVVESTTRAGYFPGAAVMQTKLIVELRSGRLLGAQIVGEENAGKRIDALAIALWNEMTVEDDRPRPGLCPTVLAGVGPRADRRPQGCGAHRRLDRRLHRGSEMSL